MTRLLEDTINAYNKLISEELDYSDIDYLIESGIISNEIFNSLLLEKNMDPVRLAYKNMKGKIKNVGYSSLASKYDSIHNFVTSGSSVMSRRKLAHSLPQLGVPEKWINKNHTGSFTDRTFSDKQSELINRFHKRDY